MDSLKKRELSRLHKVENSIEFAPCSKCQHIAEYDYYVSYLCGEYIIIFDTYLEPEDLDNPNVAKVDWHRSYTIDEMLVYNKLDFVSIYSLSSHFVRELKDKIFSSLSVSLIII